MLFLTFISTLQSRINKLKLRDFVLQLKKRKPAVAEQEHYETITGPSVQRLQLLQDDHKNMSRREG